MIITTISRLTQLSQNLLPTSVYIYLTSVILKSYNTIAAHWSQVSSKFACCHNGYPLFLSQCPPVCEQYNKICFFNLVTSCVAVHSKLFTMHSELFIMEGWISLFFPAIINFEVFILSLLVMSIRTKPRSSCKSLLSSTMILFQYCSLNLMNYSVK